MEIGSNFNFSNLYNYQSPKGDNNITSSAFANKNSDSKNGKTGQNEIPSPNTSSPNMPSKDEQKEIESLKKRDLEVKAHEQAHLAAAGGFTSGGAQFEYQTGPDGKKYAVGGHVNISTSEEKTPEATIAKMRVVQRAALAPANPSGQDRQVAAAAAQKMAEAQ
ncbi:MAG: hypothetical protein JXR91_04175, partial [Deltaproteobacteria bacterium]|nr:hypothetical protein [Deltaproteobacteria bacterium]